MDVTPLPASRRRQHIARSRFHEELRDRRTEPESALLHSPQATSTYASRRRGISFFRRGAARTRAAGQGVHAGSLPSLSPAVASRDSRDLESPRQRPRRSCPFATGSRCMSSSGRCPSCTVCVTLWTTTSGQVYRFGVVTRACARSREPAVPISRRLDSVPAGQDSFPSKAPGRRLSPLVHTQLWITLWIYPSTNVDGHVDNTVHNLIHARQRLQS